MRFLFSGFSGDDTVHLKFGETCMPKMGTLFPSIFLETDDQGRESGEPQHYITKITSNKHIECFPLPRVMFLIFPASNRSPSLRWIWTLILRTPTLTKEPVNERWSNHQSWMSRLLSFQLVPNQTVLLMTAWRSANCSTDIYKTAYSAGCFLLTLPLSLSLACPRC